MSQHHIVFETLYGVGIKMLQIFCYISVKGDKVIDMGKKQELDFIKKWILERKGGFLKYYVKHFGGIAMIMMGIFIASCIGKKEINVIYLLISVIVAGAFPFFAWEINEIRMKIYNRKNGTGKIK